MIRRRQDERKEEMSTIGRKEAATRYQIRQKMIFTNVNSNVGVSGDDTGTGESVGNVTNKKVTVCHKPNSENPVTIKISRSDLQAHLNHGDREGAYR